MKIMKIKKILNELMIIFWLFTLVSILGCIFETIFGFVVDGTIESRKGLIYGPFTPVYGIGAVIYYAFLNNVKTKNMVKLFFGAMIIGAMTEYICSLMQETLFGTVSWDYSDQLINANGRTSLLYSIMWGIVGVLYNILIMPLAENFKKIQHEKVIKIVTVIFAIYVVFDIFISSSAAIRQAERRNNIDATSSFDRILDRFYPDEIMDRVYQNKKILE